MHNRAFAWFVLLSPMLLGVVAHELEARAGGGGGYSGGGGGGGSGGGGGGDGAGIIIYLLIRLVVLLWVEGGPVGKVLAVGIVVGAIALAMRAASKQKLARQQLEQQGRVIDSRTQQRRQAQGLSLIRTHDPNFSRVLFLDFAHLMYVKFHESRGGLGLRGENAAVAPYLSPELRQGLVAMSTRIHEVVVGHLELAEVWIANGRMRVAVRYKANVVEEAGGQKVRLFYRQRFVFARPLEVLTPEPERALKLGCPNCGSAQELRLDGSCPSCGSLVGGGELSWQIVRTETEVRQRGGEPVVSGGVEIGTDLPTMYAPDLAAQRRELAVRDPAFTWPAFVQRVRHMFMEIQQGWTSLDESRLRPWETDTIFDAHRYWLQRYREEGTRNVLEDIRILQVDVAKVEHDVWYDAITVRIFASMMDYNLRPDGTVAGNKGKPRKFSEYWTLVRRSDHKARAPGDASSCPSCGAPLDKINRAGVCGYCGNRVVSGEFDWVLAIIQQDEEYRG
ncbi:MAG: TIM44-like domain-containing protein [Planctomycetes bacterium]|nr:TIM44-like domain-containing protein [Planctomycetota bacterium]